MSTRYPGTPTERRALDAYIKLARAAESVSARLAGGIADAGLTPSQLGVLDALRHLGPLCQKELGEKLLKSSGNMTLVIDNLEKRRLVRRERSAADRRYTTVHLTEAGGALVDGFLPGHVAAVTREMAALTPEEQEELARLCRKLGLAEGGAG
jgi:MarR family transcriptional regulator, 2-MHQ and catechol-resistance regulon repressor